MYCVLVLGLLWSSEGYFFVFLGELLFSIDLVSYMQHNCGFLLLLLLGYTLVESSVPRAKWWWGLLEVISCWMGWFMSGAEATEIFISRLPSWRQNNEPWAVWHESPWKATVEGPNISYNRSHTRKKEKNTTLIGDVHVSAQKILGTVKCILTFLIWFRCQHP